MVSSNTLAYYPRVDSKLLGGWRMYGVGGSSLSLLQSRNIFKSEILCTMIVTDYQEYIICSVVIQILYNLTKNKIVN